MEGKFRLVEKQRGSFSDLVAHSLFLHSSHASTRFMKTYIGYIAPNVYDHHADGWENVSDMPARARYPLKEKSYPAGGETKSGARACIVESRSIREEGKIGDPLPRDKRNLWPCLHGAPRLKLILDHLLARFLNKTHSV